MVSSPPLKPTTAALPGRKHRSGSASQGSPSSSRLHTFLSFIYSRSSSPKESSPLKPVLTERTSTDTSACFDKDAISDVSSYYNPETANMGTCSILRPMRTSASAPRKVAKTVSVSEPGKAVSGSRRASLQEAHHARIRFENEVKVCETFSKDDYSRTSVEYVARQLTPALALAIKKELNAVKQEMDVHEESRHNTQFYFVK
jgi:hypothetical protein